MQPDRIRTDEVMRRVNAGEKLVFVDAREPNDWEASEELIGGATRVPPDEVAAHAGRLPKNPLVVYCSSKGQAASLRVARDLLERGWREVRVLEGGFDAWKESRGFLAMKPSGGDVRKTGNGGDAHPYDLRAETPSYDSIPREMVAREGVGGGHAVATPMAGLPSDHRKQPGDVETRHHASKDRDSDIRDRVRVEDGGPRRSDPMHGGVPGHRESQRYADRPANRSDAASNRPDRVEQRRSSPSVPGR